MRWRYNKYVQHWESGRYRVWIQARLRHDNVRWAAGIVDNMVDIREATDGGYMVAGCTVLTNSCESCREAKELCCEHFEIGDDEC